MVEPRTLHEELVLLAVLPALAPQLHRLGHVWQPLAPHRYQCRHCATLACDPDVVLMRCDEMQAEAASKRPARSWQDHQYRGTSHDAWTRMLEQRTAYRRRKRQRDREAS